MPPYLHYVYVHVICIVKQRICQNMEVNWSNCHSVFAFCTCVHIQSVTGFVRIWIRVGHAPFFSDAHGCAQTHIGAYMHIFADIFMNIYCSRIWRNHRANPDMDVQLVCILYFLLLCTYRVWKYNCSVLFCILQCVLLYTL